MDLFKEIHAHSHSLLHKDANKPWQPAVPIRKPRRQLHEYDPSVLMQTAWRPHSPGSSSAHSSTSVQTTTRCQSTSLQDVFYHISVTHFTQTRLESPAHPASSRAKPTGQEQLPPTVTRPEGHPQPEPLPRVTWFPGHGGVGGWRLELGDTVLREAVGVKNGFLCFFMGKWWIKVEKQMVFNLHMGGVWTGVLTVRLAVTFTVNWYYIKAK